MSRVVLQTAVLQQEPVRSWAATVLGMDRASGEERVLRPTLRQPDRRRPVLQWCRAAGRVLREHARRQAGGRPRSGTCARRRLHRVLRVPLCAAGLRIGGQTFCLHPQLGARLECRDMKSHGGRGAMVVTVLTTPGSGSKEIVAREPGFANAQLDVGYEHATVRQGRLIEPEASNLQGHAAAVNATAAPGPRHHCVIHHAHSRTAELHRRDSCAAGGSAGPGLHSSLRLRRL